MPKKGELSKTARASLANREELNHMTGRVCAKCGEPIMLKELQPVKVLGKCTAFYHRNHYNLQQVDKTKSRMPTRAVRPPAFCLIA